MYKFLSNFPKEKLLTELDFNKVEVDYRIEQLKKIEEEYGKIYQEEVK